MKNVLSPITNQECVFEQHIDIDIIIKKYRDELNMDVSSYFEGLEHVSVYRCPKSKLRFYYPPSVMGTESFYANLHAMNISYYSPWKWEHEQVSKLIEKDMSVLEIGCGNGNFLKGIRNTTAKAVGLELSQKAVDECISNGLQAVVSRVEDYHSKSKFDIICSFQVLEHLFEIDSFIKSQINLLKKGALLTIGVPNNDSLIFTEDQYHTLNLPPHHIGLWNRESLTQLANIYNLELISITNSPMPRHYYSRLWQFTLKKYLGVSFLTRFLYFLTRPAAKLIYSIYRPSNGPTALAIYRKK